MSLQRGELVLVDTNVIIEAHRTGCLPQIADGFRLCTVETIIAETQAGSHNRRPEQNIDESWLRARIPQIGDVTDEQRADFVMQYQSVGLDAGERDLLIYARGLEDAWFLNSPDMAVVRFANQVGWLDRLVSLEAMSRVVKARLTGNLRGNYLESWLSIARTNLGSGVHR